MKARAGDVGVGVMQEPAVEGENVEEVEVLALVLVQPLYLDVENRFGVELYAAELLHYAGEASLVCALDVHVLLLEGRVAGMLFEPAEHFEVLWPAAVPKGFGYEV